MTGGTRIFTNEHRANLGRAVSEALKRKTPEERELHIQRIIQSRGRATGSRLEETLLKVLHDCGVDFLHSVAFGRYRVDFYLPQKNVALECDGLYYHPDAEKDAARDRYLLSEFGLHTVRIAEAALKKDPVQALLAALRQNPQDGV